VNAFRIARNELRRLTAGESLKRVQLGVKDGDFDYAFD